jgi:hypothetical protein
MTRVHQRSRATVLAFSAALLALLSNVARAEWQRDATSIAWLEGTQVVWKFSFDPQVGKPFFHPLSVAGGPTLTMARPDDHPWHYGLWFSWKYINGMNYWEEGRETGRSEGVTAWKVAALDTRPDGSVTIRLDITYTHPSGRVDLVEKRALQVSAPTKDGAYAIDWQSHFKAGSEGALLDRTPMPGERDGQVNGGYAGLGLRLAPDPLAITFVSSAGPIAQFVDNRARPAAAAVAANLVDGEKEAGGIAIFSDPANSGVDTPWYLVDAPQNHMRFACAAVLAPKPITLAPGAAMQLNYRIAIRRAAWTAEELQ